MKIRNTSYYQKIIKNKKFLNTLLWYSVFFIIVGCFIYLPFLQAGSTLVTNSDAIEEYILWLRYTGQAWHQFFGNLLHGHLSFPFYDFAIGMGADTRLFLKTEPVLLLGALFTQGHASGIVYSVLILIRIYLIGLSFFIYASYHKKDSTNAFAIISASLAYAYSSYVLFWVNRHPQFAVGCVLLPLFMLGLDRIAEGKSSRFFTLVTAMSLFCGYYFHYMNSVVIACYTLYLLIRYKKISHLGKIIYGYGLGCMMSIVFVLSSIGNYFSSNRSVEVKHAIDWSSYFHWRSPMHFLYMLLIPDIGNEYNTIITVSILIIPSICILIGHFSKKRIPLLIILTVLSISWCLPFVSYVMSGFEEVNGRWGYIITFVLCLILLEGFSELISLKIPAVICWIIFILFYFYQWGTEYVDSNYKYYFVILLTVFFIVGFVNVFPIIPDSIRYSILFMVGLAGIGLNGYNQSRQMQSDALKAWEVDAYFAQMQLKNSVQEKNTFSRIDNELLDDSHINQGVYDGNRYLAMYTSTQNEGLIHLLKETENIGLVSKNRFLGMDERSSMLTLAGVDKVIYSGLAENTFLYGFDEAYDSRQKNNGMITYMNEAGSMSSYAYDQVIKRSEYEKLTALEKQEVMLHAAVLPDEMCDKISEKHTDIIISNNSDQNAIPIVKKAVHTILVKEAFGDGYAVDRQKEKETEAVYYTVNADDEGYYDFIYDSTKSEEEIEKYLNDPDTELMDRTDYKSESYPGIHFSVDVSKGQQAYLRLENLECDDPDGSAVILLYDNQEKMFSLKHKENNYYRGSDDYLVNLGYFEKDKTLDITMRFLLDGRYRLDSFCAYTVDMGHYDQGLAHAKSLMKSNLSFKENGLTGEVIVDQDTLLCESILYQEGWTARIDGKKTKIYPCNTAYMGILVPKGKHVITFSYKPSGFWMTMILSALTWFYFALKLFL